MVTLYFDNYKRYFSQVTEVSRGPFSNIIPFRFYQSDVLLLYSFQVKALVYLLMASWILQISLHPLLSQQSATFPTQCRMLFDISSRNIAHPTVHQEMENAQTEKDEIETLNGADHEEVNR